MRSFGKGFRGGGFGCGGFIFTFLTTKLCNPDNVESSKTALKPFPMSVAENFPLMLRKLFYICSGIWIFTLITIQDLP